MNPRNALVASAVLLGLALILVFIGPLLREDGERGALRVGTSEEFLDFARAQARTDETLLRIEALLAEKLENTGTPSDLRRPADGAPPQSLDELIRSLDELRVTLERESRVTQELIRHAPGYDGGSLKEELVRREGIDWDKLNSLREVWLRDEAAAVRSQQFLTTRELFASYGQPTRIIGHNYVYRRFPYGTPQPEWWFGVKDELVVSLEIHDI